MDVLDQALGPHLDLHIAFEHPVHTHGFRHNGVSYHPLSRPFPRLYRLRQRLGLPTGDHNRVAVYRELVRELQPDVVHIHGTENAFGLVIGQIETPTIVSIQGVIGAIKEKLYSPLDLGRPEFFPFTWRLVTSAMWWRQVALMRLRYRQAARNELRTLSMTRWLLGRTKWDRRIASVLAPQAWYFHVDELMRKPFSDVRWTPSTADAPVLFSTTSDLPYKGFETMARTFALLLRLHPSLRWQVAGLSATSRIVQYVKARLGADYPSRDFDFVGVIPAVQLAKLLSSATVYISPSHIENSPNSLSEALLVGVPCVATTAGGTSSLIDDPWSGKLVQDGDYLAMAGAVQEYLQDPVAAARVAAVGQSRAESRHDTMTVMHDLLNVYEHVIDSVRLTSGEAIKS